MGCFSFFSMLYKFSFSICTTVWNYFITITIPWNNLQLATPSVKTAKKPVRTPRSTTFLHGNISIFKYVIFCHTTKVLVNLPYFISPYTEEKSSMKEKHGRSRAFYKSVIIINTSCRVRQNLVSKLHIKVNKPSEAAHLSVAT